MRFRVNNMAVIDLGLSWVFHMISVPGPVIRPARNGMLPMFGSRFKSHSGFAPS